MTFPDFEFAGRDTIEQIQFDLLKRQLEYAAQNSPYYRDKFNSIGFNLVNFNKKEDLTSLPFTTKEDFANFNSNFFCVPRQDIADYVTTSGTLGNPVSYILSHNDLDRLAINEALSFKCAGIQPGDTISLMTTQDKRFMAGLAYALGARHLHCGLIRTGPGVPSMQWDSITRFAPEHLIAVPSFIPRLLDYADSVGLDPNSTAVKSIMCIGEPIRDQNFNLNALGKRISSRWDVQLYSTYASTEMAAAFTECEHQVGGHLRPDLVYLEVIDDDGRPVSSGQPGEVVVTTLGVEGTPLVRYRTGDICTLHEEPCSCGRHTPRLGPVIGRKQQMIKFKGTTIYPPQIFDLLDAVTVINDYVVRVSLDEYGNDHVEVVLHEAVRSDDLVKNIQSAFRARIRVTPELSFIHTDELRKLKHPAGQRKPQKLIDLR